MTTRGILGFAIFLFVLALIDLYAYKGVNTAMAQAGPGLRRWVRLGYWALSIGMLALLVWVAVSIQDLRSTRNHSFMFSLAALFMLFLLPKVVIVLFHGLEDLVEGGRWLLGKLTPGDPVASGDPISRLRFLSQVGLALSAVPFVGVLYGITQGRRNFRVERVRLTSNKLPVAFDGLRIVQISDLHLGSFPASTDIVRRGVDLINEERPDLVLFTGDLVNDYADEAEAWVNTLKDLQARLGKYAILGNHDYSDYAQWDRAEDKRANLERLKRHHAAMGFRLMLDEHTRIERDGQAITLLGVQNWGRRFQQYGDLAKAMQGHDPGTFRILMSHDPTHWEEQVLGTGIELTLSGHTHGAQFGITIAGQTYSPAQWVYKRWAGLYSEGAQQLYVNRGFGYIGFPGRVGMPPEITVFELRCRAEAPVA
ncbi:MAG: metallophosphoesterase [Flavobacteriales bacterium]|nr:3',5'-cyclic adenosine monophosphate phosphodiesterase CpdA [Flavobacteriales bacterium]MCC6577303.1 metallophosphoesterase [Flavobacteriales bacterium]NUQ13744.1 metallophosphoesterase [Flavobacteriales bacterium]